MSLTTKQINNIKTMYSTARQFKNAILIDEIIQHKNNKHINKIFPFIVNKSFACEVYLKTINKIEEKQDKKIHNLVDLANVTGINEYFKEYLKKTCPKLTEKEIDDSLQNISNAFEDWRYFYEQQDIKIMHGFLNSYCDFLDKFCKQLMFNKLNIDVEKELIYI